MSRAHPADSLLDGLAPIVGGVAVRPDALGALGREGGAYVLALRLAEPLVFSRRALGRATLSGWLAYVGSAHGPGGLAARLARHFRPGKPVRWHVDELTNAAAVFAAQAVPGGRECDLVARLIASGLFEPAFPGFGSSDCPRCAAHLLRRK